MKPLVSPSTRSPPSTHPPSTHPPPIPGKKPTRAHFSWVEPLLNCRKYSNEPSRSRVLESTTFQSQLIHFLFSFIFFEYEGRASAPRCASLSPSFPQLSFPPQGEQLAHNNTNNNSNNTNNNSNNNSTRHFQDPFSTLSLRSCFNVCHRFRVVS